MTKVDKHIDDGFPVKNVDNMEGEKGEPLLDILETARDIEHAICDHTRHCSVLTPAMRKDSSLEPILEKVTENNSMLASLSRDKGVTHQGKNSTPVETRSTDESIQNEVECSLKLMDVARSVEQMVNAGFVYESDSNLFICAICLPDYDIELIVQQKKPPGGVFCHDDDMPLRYAQDSIVDRKFRNLKSHMKTHLQSSAHAESIKAKNDTYSAMSKYNTRTEKVGLLIGTTAYHILYSRGTVWGFEQLLLLNNINHIDIGDTNHSTYFIWHLRPYVAKVVQSKMTTFFSTPFKQTGHLPPVNASADKATYKHRTRQFTAVTTVVPDAENLFQVAYVGTPVVKDHTGYGLATTWKDSLDSKSIVGKQIVRWSTDGQYINLDTTRPLQNMYPDCHVELTWDPLHLAGLADAHLDKEEFEWLSSDVEVYQDLYNKFNWGKSYEELMDASAELEVKFVGLSKTCQTRFANSKRLVFINII